MKPSERMTSARSADAANTHVSSGKRIAAETRAVAQDFKERRFISGRSERALRGRRKGDDAGNQQVSEEHVAEIEPVRAADASRREGRRRRRPGREHCE